MNTIIKHLLTPIAALLLLAGSLTAIAQTNTVTVSTNNLGQYVVSDGNGNTIVLPAPPQVSSGYTGAFANFEAILNLHDATKEYFLNTNEVSLKIGTSTTTLRPGVDMNNDLSFYHRLASGNYYGAGVSVDSIGSGGQSCEAISIFPAKFAFNWDNLRPEIGVGYLRDVVANAHAVVGDLGIDYRFNKTSGFFFGVTPGYEITAAKTGSKAFIGAVVSASFGIGK